MTRGHDVRPAKWSDVIDLFDDGDYSAIWGRYENAPQRVLGTRWNGYGDSKGFPLSSGHPVWHVEPDFLAKGILSALLDQTLSTGGSGGRRDDILTAMSELAMRRERNSIHVAIALYASQNKGKTATLNKLIECLEADGIDKDKCHIEANGSADKLFCCKYKNRTVGVATGGDDDSSVKTAFEFFLTYNCDIVFCATRSRSDSSSWKKFVEQTNSCHARIVLVKKREAEAPDQDAVNMAQAKELLALIERNGVV